MFVSVSVSIYSVSSVVMLPKYYITFQPFRADLYTTPRHAKLNLRFEGDRANKVKEPWNRGSTALQDYFIWSN